MLFRIARQISLDPGLRDAMAAEKEDTKAPDAEETPAPARTNDEAPAPVEGATIFAPNPADRMPSDDSLTTLIFAVGAKRSVEDAEGPQPDSAKRSKVADDSDDDEKADDEATKAEPETAADAAEKKAAEAPEAGEDAAAPAPEAASPADQPAAAPASNDMPTAEIGVDPAEAVAAAAAAAAAHAAAMAPPAPILPVAAPVPAEPVVKELDCPGNQVGRIIGKGGETIKGMMAQSGAHIAMNQAIEGDVKKVVITGHQACVDVAEALVTRLLQTPVGASTIDAGFLGPGQESRIIECPKNMVGRIIGKGGETIKGLQVHSGARVQVDQTVGDPCHVVIAGAPPSVHYAAEAVDAIIQGGPTQQYAVGQAQAGGGYGGYGGYGGGYAQPAAAYGAAAYGAYGGYPAYGYPAAYGGYPGYGMMGGYDPAAATAAAQQTAAAAAAPVAAAGGDWQAVDDGTGKTYYYNGKTGVSQWEKPPGM